LWYSFDNAFSEIRISKMPLPTLNSKDSSKSILIVDDDRNILEHLPVFFGKYGFMVYKAEDGLKAWDLFKNENIDVVLTDIRMPGLDGRELSYRIRHQSPSTVIALMTGEKSDVGIELLNDGTVDYFFLKPFDNKKVCEIFRAELKAA
jgi:DNA-binding response OmpR family regulator